MFCDITQKQKLPIYTNDMNDPQKHYATYKEPNAKDPIFCDFIYIKFPERANPQSQKVGLLFSGSEGGNRELFPKGHGEILLGQWKCSKTEL